MLMMFTTKPQPEAAISLIHKQPVRWTKNRIVSCDGGGGPLGHPRIFINVDKPQINWCTYCGLPYVRLTPEIPYIGSSRRISVCGHKKPVWCNVLTRSYRRKNIIENISRVCHLRHIRWNPQETGRKLTSRNECQMSPLGSDKSSLRRSLE